MIEVRRADGPDDLRAALDLRHEVFVVEQRVPLHEELDGRDDEAEHLVALDGGRVVGTCRLLHEHGVTKLGRVAVTAPARGRGIAGGLLARAEEDARRAGSHTMVLDAQTAARGLYERAGYRAQGEEFLDAGIPHLKMVKALS